LATWRNAYASGAEGIDLRLTKGPGRFHECPELAIPLTTSIAKDFNLIPILAEAYFTRISDYFVQHAKLALPTDSSIWLWRNMSLPASPSHCAERPGPPYRSQR